MQKTKLLLARENHAKRMLEENLRKLTRTATQVKKWSKKVAYYESKIRKVIAEESQPVQGKRRAFFLHNEEEG